jgi:large subunit ribosomal protein L25
MNQSIDLKLEERTTHGRRAAAKMRADGYLPAVVYGHGVDSKEVMASYREVAKAYNAAGKHSPVELTVNGKKHLAMFKRVDVEPVKHKLQHAAFYVVKQNEKVQTEVPVHIKGEGETPAEKAGLVLIKNVDSVQLEAFPRDLVDALEVDGEQLAEAGHSITVADLKSQVPATITILSDDSQVIVSAVEPAALEAANAAADDAADDGDASDVASDHGEAEEEDEKTAENSKESKES